MKEEKQTQKTELKPQPQASQQPLIERHFTEGDPFESITWERRDALIGSEDNPVFFQANVEVPSFWSQNATNIVAQKYFAYDKDDPRREDSVRTLINRVVDRLAAEGIKNGYFNEEEAKIFSDELKYIVVHQLATFNSPVWFNIGVEGAPQQASACFILDVEDNMESISRWYAEEMKIFKGGSGAGLNLSKLRSAGEILSKGGHASGPVTFMRGADANAGTIKSGGRTRRAAKLVCLDASHPDIEDFINCKVNEEERIRILAEAGLDMGFGEEGEKNLAEATSYQNANNSVRVTDEFMEAVEADGNWQLRSVVDGEVVKVVKARELMQSIAEAAWRCADPGLQYDTTINDWHTTPAEGPIEASNPCSEYMSNSNSACNLASLNLRKFFTETGEFLEADYLQTIRVMFTAQDVTISFADFPTKKIGKNTRALRQIGLGYANVGALLMSEGLPYDSEEGRALIAGLTSMLTAEAYFQSTRLAERIAPFDHYTEYPENQEAILQVFKKHLKASKELSDKAGLLREDERLERISKDSTRIWQKVIRNTRANGVRNAQATVAAPTGCVLPNTLISTDKGLIKIKNLKKNDEEQWQNIDCKVATDYENKDATQFYINGKADVVEIKTEKGYGITGTPNHRIKTFDKGEFVWKRLDQIKSQDIVPIKLGSIIGSPQIVKLPPLGETYWHSNNTIVPESITSELAEFVGYFMGDGSLHAKGIRMCVFEEDTDVIDRLKYLGKKLFNLEAKISQQKGYIDVSFHSVPLVMWWDACDFKKGAPEPENGFNKWRPHIPDSILRTNDPEIYKAFLKGLYEADGSIYANSNSISFYTARKCFAESIQNLLLSLGFVTGLKTQTPSKNRFSNNPMYRLSLSNLIQRDKFLDEIGFISKRKQEKAREEIGNGHPKLDSIPITRDFLDALFETYKIEDKKLKQAVFNSIRKNNYISRVSAQQLFSITKNDKLRHYLSFYYDKVSKAEELPGQYMTYDISVPEGNTYIANGLISHNTISFKMDCDTTGIEPDFSLVKHKILAGGGDMTIVNQTVTSALKKLGYDAEQTREIIDYIIEDDPETGTPRNSVIDAPHLRREHYSVFDCAVGEREITPLGHIRMVAAVQPFLSGSVSKTVNIPNHYTPDDIIDLYIKGWEMRTKSLSVYRDGSKSNQPLNAGKKKDQEAELVEVVIPEHLRRGSRRKIERDAKIVGVDFKVGQVGGYIHVRLFEDGTPGAIFLDVGQAGSTLHGFIRAWAVTMSLALQYGMPLDHLVRKLSWTQFEPSGITNDPDIRIAKSIVDYVVRWLAKEFLDPESGIFEELGISRPEVVEEIEDIPGGKIEPKSSTHAETKPASSLKEKKKQQVLSLGTQMCDDCGGNMVRTGACHTCTVCGKTGGCG